MVFSDVGALIIGIGFGAHFSTMIVRNPHKNIGNHLGPYSNYSTLPGISGKLDDRTKPPLKLRNQSWDFRVKPETLNPGFSGKPPSASSCWHSRLFSAATLLQGSFIGLEQGI